MIGFRIGHGYDIHRLQTGGQLVLAGVKVADDISPIAHSDGDVVIHAIVDAMLGAMAMGDIGQHFPDSDPKWKGAASSVFLQTIYQRVTTQGYQLQNVDVTILAERPKLAEFRQQMCQTLAKVMRVSTDCVNIKAGTNEGLGEIGRGEAIAAHAVVLLATEDSIKSTAT